MFVNMSDNMYYILGGIKHLRNIVCDVCEKYNITPDKIYFDYEHHGIKYYNMRIYNVDLLYKCDENLINNDDFWSNVKKIEHPDDLRGYWNCAFCNIISLCPLKFRVDGILFTILV